MSKSRWVKYGVTGAIGLGVIAGAASATAAAMELRTDRGTVLDGGGLDAHMITGNSTPGNDGPTVSPSAIPSVSPTPGRTQSPSADTPPEYEAPSPAKVERLAPVYVDYDDSAPSAPSVPSAPSTISVDTRD